MVSSTSPSGTMPTRPATADRTAGRHGCTPSWRRNSTGPMITMATVSQRRMRLIPPISSEPVSEKRRASLASRPA